MITATASETTATTKHAILQRILSGKKKKKQTRTMRYGTNACHSLVSSVDTIDFYYDLCVWRNLTTGGTIIFAPSFLCRKCMVHPRSMPWNMSQTKSILLCVVVLVRTYFEVYCLHENKTMSICPNLYNTTLGAPGTQPLAVLLCGFLWGSNPNHYNLLLVLVMRPLATTISMYVCTCTYTEIQKINALLWYLQQYRGDFCYSKYY